jgi:hypothetical protein
VTVSTASGRYARCSPLTVAPRISLPFKKRWNAEILPWTIDVWRAQGAQGLTAALRYEQHHNLRSWFRKVDSRNKTASVFSHRHRYAA